ncbi:hypothetical protein [Paenibacillus barcinonensis]|uniref:hypothetical protein n=1 Tax=Paenibacillus barcinonensis TaxID=198119 RepID=UPI00209D90BA|nr:hypothetical protein [Paenibacillus barcinonensis]
MNLTKTRVLVVDDHAHAREAIREILSMDAQRIMIATTPGFVPQVVQSTLELMQSYPALKVQMIEGDTQTVMKHVQDGYANMGLLSFV